MLGKRASAERCGAEATSGKGATDRVVDVVKEWEREAGAYEGVSTKVEQSPYTTREDLPP